MKERNSGAGVEEGEGESGKDGAETGSEEAEERGRGEEEAEEGGEEEDGVGEEDASESMDVGGTVVLCVVVAADGSEEGDEAGGGSVGEAVAESTSVVDASELVGTDSVLVELICTAVLESVVAVVELSWSCGGGGD